MIKASAPGRAGIIGNPTDMYGGSVISCSISERAYCHLSSSDRLEISIGGESSVIRNSEDLALDGGKFDLARAAIRALEIDPASAVFSLSLRTDIPEQAGLAGSTAMLASIVGCLVSYLDLELNKYELAETVRQIESNIMRITCGYQDHYMAVFGGMNYMDFRGKEWMRQLCDEPFATVEPLSECVGCPQMVLAHTGVKRNSGSVHKSLRERWLEGEKQVVDSYLRIGEIGRMGKKAMIEEDMRGLGELMNENHAIQRDLGGSAECNEKLIEAALSNGAYGAKLAGAGHGGTIIALTDDPDGMAGSLLNAGAERILIPRPVDGLVVEREW